MSDSEHRWKLIFDLAWDQTGLTIDLQKVPDLILEKFVTWRNEKVEAEKS